jgi:hypothetical protein
MGGEVCAALTLTLTLMPPPPPPRGGRGLGVKLSFLLGKLVLYYLDHTPQVHFALVILEGCVGGWVLHEVFALTGQKA